MNEVQVTLEDVGELCRINPLAAEQLKSIALQRRLAAAEAMLAEKNGTHSEVENETPV